MAGRTNGHVYSARGNRKGQREKRGKRGGGSSWKCFLALNSFTVVTSACVCVLVFTYSCVRERFFD